MNSVAFAVEPAESELPLDFPDLVAYRGLDSVQMLGGARETAIFHDGLERFETIQIELHGYCYWRSTRSKSYAFFERADSLNVYACRARGRAGRVYRVCPTDRTR